MSATTTVRVITRRCGWCSQPGVVEVPRDGFEAWQAGVLAQVALPSVDVAIREQLISGTHPACWTAMFGGDAA